MNNELKDKWEEAYENRNNFIFYPSEYIIRFLSKYVKKRVGYDQFDIIDHTMKKSLDLGCGIGTNTFLCDDFNIESHGIDLSEVAIKYAKELAVKNQKKHLNNNFIVGSATNLPYLDNEFDLVISHGVLDSMSLELSKKSFDEVFRVLRKEGLFNVDLICADGINYSDGFSGETIVQTDHEKDTIQLFFNEILINELIGDKFIILEKIVETREYKVEGIQHKRFYLTLKKL